MEDLKKIISSLGVTNEVIELNRESIAELPETIQIVMPDDSVHKSSGRKIFKEQRGHF